jgi:hypothetical protein
MIFSVLLRSGIVKKSPDKEIFPVHRSNLTTLPTQYADTRLKIICDADYSDLLRGENLNDK